MDCCKIHYKTWYNIKTELLLKLKYNLKFAQLSACEKFNAISEKNIITTNNQVFRDYEHLIIYTHSDDTSLQYIKKYS